MRMKSPIRPIGALLPMQSGPHPPARSVALRQKFTALRSGGSPALGASGHFDLICESANLCCLSICRFMVFQYLPFYGVLVLSKLMLADQIVSRILRDRAAYFMSFWGTQIFGKILQYFLRLKICLRYMRWRVLGTQSEYSTKLLKFGKIKKGWYSPWPW